MDESRRTQDISDSPSKSKPPRASVSKGKTILQNTSPNYNSKNSILEKTNEGSLGDETNPTDNKKTEKLKPKKTSKQKSMIELTMENYKPKEHPPARSPKKQSPPNSPKFDSLKRQEQKEGNVQDSVSYLQQVFIQRKQEDMQN